MKLKDYLTEAKNDQKYFEKLVMSLRKAGIQDATPDGLAEIANMFITKVKDDNIIAKIQVFFGDDPGDVDLIYQTVKKVIKDKGLTKASV